MSCSKRSARRSRWRASISRRASNMARPTAPSIRNRRCRRCNSTTARCSPSIQAIATYLARTHPEKGLLPEAPLAQARMYEALDYVVGTIHTDGFRRVFRPNYFAVNESDYDAVKARGREIVAGRLRHRRSDACGAANGWRAISPSPTPLCSMSPGGRSRGSNGRSPAGVAAHYERMMRRARACEGARRRGAVK